jgi:hypothetical protein
MHRRMLFGGVRAGPIEIASIALAARYQKHFKDAKSYPGW